MEQRPAPPKGHAPMARPSLGVVVRSVVSAAFGIWVLAQLQGDLFVTSAGPLLIGAYGATAVLVFGAPHSPLAQPYNVVVGHLISAVIGVTSFQVMGEVSALSTAIAVALSIGAMQLTRSVHPPGGATALIAVIGSDAVHQLGYEYILNPVGSGALILVLSAFVTNNWGNAKRWPTFWLPFSLKRTVAEVEAEIDAEIEAGIEAVQSAPQKNEA